MKAQTTYEGFRRLRVPRNDTSIAPTSTPGRLARHSGRPSFVRKHGPIGSALRAVTGSGGHHYFFRWPGRPVSNSVGKVAPGVDVRGECSRLGVRSPAGLPYKLLKLRKGVAA